MRNLTGLWKQSFIGLIWSMALSAIAHEGKTHRLAEEPPTEQSKLAFEKMNEQYLQNVKTIFQNKCFDCHSSQMNRPWYRNVPGAKQLIDWDITEAKEHLNMDAGFPFKSHATPIEDLEAIEKSIKENEMPPLRYRLLHPGSKLSEVEKQKIYQWIAMGRETLQKTLTALPEK